MQAKYVASQLNGKVTNTYLVYLRNSWRKLRKLAKGVALSTSIHSTTAEQPRPLLPPQRIFRGTPVLYLGAYEVVTYIEICQCLVHPHVLDQVCRL